MDIEEIIRRAQNEGRFKDLPGKGKPLNLADRGDQDPVHAMMKEAGIAPGWATLGKEIDSLTEEMDRLHAGSARTRQLRLAEARSYLQHGDATAARTMLESINADRDRFADRLAKAAIEIRKLTELYNLLVPMGAVQRLLLSPERHLSQYLDESPDLRVSADNRSIEAAPTRSAQVHARAILERIRGVPAPEKAAMDPVRAAAVSGLRSTLRFRGR